MFGWCNGDDRARDVQLLVAAAREHQAVASNPELTPDTRTKAEARLRLLLERLFDLVGDV